MGNTVIYGSGQTYLLDLGGQAAGKLHSFTPGNRVAGLSQAGNSPSAPKTQVTIDAMELSCGAGMNSFLQEWIRNALDKSYMRKDGSVTVLDVSQKATLSMDFNNALISEFSTPALDRSAKDEGYFTIFVRSERVSARTGQHSFDPMKLPKYGPPSRPVNTTKYKLVIGGLEKECADVTKIASLSLKLGVASDDNGPDRNANLLPSGKVDESDLVLTMPASSVGGFYDWFTSTMTQGTRSQSNNKNGSLEYFAADTDKRELRLEFKELGIKSLSLPRKDDLNSQDPAKISLYYDSVNLAR